MTTNDDLLWLTRQYKNMRNERWNDFVFQATRKLRRQNLLYEASINWKPRPTRAAFELDQERGDL